MGSRFTVEERNLDKKDTLDMLKDGISQHEIARELGRSVQYINNLKKELVAKGLIDDEKIKEYRRIALDNKVLELVNAQFDISSIAKEIGISRDTIRNSIKRLIAGNRLVEGKEAVKNSRERKAKNKEQQKALVLERLLAGNINAKQIQEDLGIAETTLNQYVKQLISEGKITREMWENRNNETSETDPEKEKQVLELLYSGKYNKFEVASMAGVYVKYVVWVSENLLDKSKVAPKEKAAPIESEEIQEEILRNLKNGLTYKYIARILNLDSDQVTETIRLLKSKNRITSEEIRSARKQRIEEDRKQILIYLRRGYTYQEIFDEMEGIYEKNYIKHQADFLMSKGLITPEKYKKYREEAPQGINDIADIVLEGLRAGKSYNDMINEDESGYLSLKRIKNAKQLLVSSEKITDKEIASYRESRLKRQQRFIDALVIQGLKQGKIVKEIMESGESDLLTEGRVRDSIERLIKKGRITESEIEGYRKQAEEVRQRKLDKFVLRQLKLGKSQEEIFKEYTKYPVSQKEIFRSRQRLLTSGRITKEQINEGIRERNLQDFKIRSSKSTFPGDFDNELITMLKYGFSVEEIAKYFNLSVSRMYRYITPTIKQYGITYNDIKNYKIQSAIEYKELKERAKEDSNRLSQANFFEMLKFYGKHGRSLSNDELKIMEDIILMNFKLLSAENLKFIIMQYINDDCLSSAIKFINQCLNTYKNTTYTNALRDFKSEIDSKLKQKQIRDLAKRGLSTSQIASELKMLEIDVIRQIRSSSSKEGPGGRD